MIQTKIKFWKNKKKFSKIIWKNFTKNFNFWSTDWQRNKGNAVDTLPWFVIISRLSHPRTRSGRVRSRGRIVILLEDRFLGPWIPKKMGKLVCLDCLRFVSPSTTLWVQFGLIKPVKIIEKIVKLFYISLLLRVVRDFPIFFKNKKPRKISPES